MGKSHLEIPKFGPLSIFNLSYQGKTNKYWHSVERKPCPAFTYLWLSTTLHFNILAKDNLLVCGFFYIIFPSLSRKIHHIYTAKFTAYFAKIYCIGNKLIFPEDNYNNISTANN